MYTNNNSYIGAEVKALKSIYLTIKYIGAVETNVMITEGSLCSIGYVGTGNQYNNIVGVVRAIGISPQQRAFNTTTESPYYLRVDASTTCGSDMRDIYIRDIREIAVGPNVHNNYNITKFMVEQLPEVTTANKDVYLGTTVYLTTESMHYPKGLYICIGIDNLYTWAPLTSKVSGIQSSPLIDSIGVTDPKNPIYNLNRSVVVHKESINVDSLDAKLATELSPFAANSIKMQSIGDYRVYQIHVETPFTAIVTGTTACLYLGSVEKASMPNADSPIQVSKLLDTVSNTLVDVYYKVTAGGRIELYMPKDSAANIKAINIIGSYIL